MSAGSFLNTGYETNTDVIHPIRVQPETLSLTLNSVSNAAPTTAIATSVPSAKVSGSRRAIGVNARLVRVRITDGTPPDGYVVGGVITLPVLTQVAFAAYAKGTTGTYTLNGTAYAIEFVGKTPETIV